MNLIVLMLLAHSAGIGTATVRPEDDGSFTVRVRLPAGAAPVQARISGEAAARSTPFISTAFEGEPAVAGLDISEPELVGSAVETRIHVRAADRLELEVGRHAVVARWPNEAPRLLEEEGGWVQVPLKQRSEGIDFGRWLRDGVLHILGGVDHLLFLLGLCLLGGRKNLFAQVSVFTVAHSISLGLSAFGIVHLPSPPVEACIALSIAWVGWAGLRRASHGTGLPVIFAFGLLHGIGFASALSAAGLPVGRAALALLGFNLGVEAGQLLVLVALVPLVAAMDRSRLPLRAAASWGLGAVGVAWTLERVVGFWS